MIKNTLIAILSLTVIGLSWMGFSSLKNTQEFKQDFQQKIFELKSQIHDAYRVAYQQDDAELEHSSSSETADTKDQDEAPQEIITVGESIIERNINSENPRPMEGQPSTQSVVDILNGVKQKRVDNDNWMTTKELESVLSNLKSAQQLLRKTSFTFTNKPVDTSSESIKSQTSAIKKKLSNGPEKSG